MRASASAIPSVFWNTRSNSDSRRSAVVPAPEPLALPFGEIEGAHRGQLGRLWRLDPAKKLTGEFGLPSASRLSSAACVQRSHPEERTPQSSLVERVRPFRVLSRPDRLNCGTHLDCDQDRGFRIQFGNHIGHCLTDCYPHSGNIEVARWHCEICAALLPVGQEQADAVKLPVTGRSPRGHRSVTG